MPSEIRTSFLLWLAAVGAGVVEAFLAGIDSTIRAGRVDLDLISGIGVRLAIFLVAIHVITEMALGRNWARLTLAVLLGGAAVRWLVTGPVHWLAGAGSWSGTVAGAGTLDLMLAASRLAFVAATLPAIAYMFRPAANRFIRAQAHRRAQALDTASVTPVGSAH